MKSKNTLAAAFLGAAFLLGAASSSAQIWNFDTNDQGWQVVDFPGTANYTPLLLGATPAFNATGGNTGGYISARDPSSGTFMFSAPSASLGNYSGYLGGTFSFSLKTDQGTPWTADSVAVLRGSGLTLIAAITSHPGASWTNYSFGLTAANFRYNNLAGASASATDFATVLGNISHLYINGEFVNGVVETTGLDSVAFQRAQTPGTSAVPEPSTYGLFAAAGLLGLVAWRRRRSR